MALYLLVALAVFGTLTTSEVIAARENALAEAARPVFGSAGFVLVSITALIATGSGINASLYAFTNVTYRMAKDGELPGTFGHPVAHSREGLLISAAIVSVLAVGFDLSQIAVLGAVSILTVHTVVHVGHLRLTDQTGAHRSVVALAALFGFAAVTVTLVDTYRSSPPTIVILIVFAAAAGSPRLGYRTNHSGTNRRPHGPVSPWPGMLGAEPRGLWQAQSAPHLRLSARRRSRGDGSWNHD